jgi:general secretion pathway protein N
LLTFKPAINVNFGDNLGRGPKGKATISGSLEALVVEQLNIQVQADLIAQQLPLPIPIEAKDSVDVVINRFVMGKPLCTEITGSIVWPNAAVTALNEQVTLGRLATKLDCQRGQIELMVDPNNDLGLTFTAAIGRNFKTSGKGFLSVNNKTPEAIKQLTPFLGKPDREGRYVLTF